MQPGITFVHTHTNIHTFTHTHHTRTHTGTHTHEYTHTQTHTLRTFRSRDTSVGGGAWLGTDGQVVNTAGSEGSVRMSQLSWSTSSQFSTGRTLTAYVYPGHRPATCVQSSAITCSKCTRIAYSYLYVCSGECVCKSVCVCVCVCACA